MTVVASGKLRLPAERPLASSHGYEFGGPFGAAAISLGASLILILFTFACNDVSGCPAPSLLSPKTLTLDRLKQEVGWPGFAGLMSLKATAAVLGYYLFNALLYRFLPATEMDGVELACGGRLKYRFNAFSSSMGTLALLLAGTLVQGAEFPVWTFISDNYVQIFVVNLVMSYALAVYVYVRSFQVKAGNSDLREIAGGGRTGNMVYDWFIGRELNPRVVLPVVGEIDIKVWCELRPGMLGWLMLDLAWLAKQHRTFGFVTYSLLLVVFIQAVYIVDSWYYESAFLTTIDVTTDGLGFMLLFGVLAWVPFLYSTSARYLAIYPHELSPGGFAVMCVIGSIGYYIFRSSNSQKNLFRTDPSHPSVAHLSCVKVPNGSMLITSGWWGIARHINYFGDWLQSWTYCLPTGVAGCAILAAGSGATPGALAPDAFVMADGRVVVPAEAKGWAMPITYFYIVYFAVLLIHRERRDDTKCEAKHGAGWQAYKRAVKWRIVPGIY